MSRLDRHVAMVQNKLALDRFVQALAWSAVFYAAAVWVGILVDRFIHVKPPHVAWFMWGGVAACGLAALIYAIIRRPTAHEAAVAIDDRLALKEKFSTALYARPMKDPFAQAAVKDAERTADNVSLHKRFPLEFPRQSLGAVGIGILVAITMAVFTDRVYLFGKPTENVALKTEKAKIDDARAAVERALQVVVETQAKGVADDEAIKQAKSELEQLKNQPIRDPDSTKRSAARALSDLNDALKQQISSNQAIADAQNDAKAFKSLMPADDEKGPVADAQRKIAKGDFDQAVDEISKSVEKFDKMNDEEKKKAAEQMAKMAEQLKQMAAQADNPQQQQQLQQQLQQAGLNQQQAQQAQQLMQQAAQGNKQAQQQLQQMAQQAMKQMNNGQGPNPQQQQAIQQMMKQMQAQANAQQQAQQMAQAAQQMAQAMKQQAQNQQANQNGGQKGQQNAQQQAQAQQMAQGMQQMQQQLGAMQAMKADAQQLAAAQQNAAQAAQQAAGACNNPGGNPGQQGQGQQGQWAGNNNGQWKQGDNRQFKGPNNGMGGAGIGAGDRTFKQEAPYAVKQEVSQSQDIENGKILASSLIKAKSIKGETHVGASDVAAPPEQQQTDEIEQDRISKPAQQAVKEYFSAWQKDAANK